MSRVLVRSATLAPRETVAALQESGVDVISLVGGGTPAFDLPQDAKSTIIETLMSGPIGTTDSRGLASLRAALAEDLEAEGIEAEPERIIVTVGAKEATMATFMGLLDAGDEVLLPDPAWVGYEPWILRAGATPVPFAMGKETGFRPDWEDLERRLTGQTKLLLLTNPNNPTGTLLSASDLDRVRELVNGTDVVVVSDESNCRLVYDGLSHTSPLSDPGMVDRTILIRSFSKSFAMPGWRVGFVTAPAQYFETILAAHEHTVSCVPTLVQTAALAVMHSPETPEMVGRMVGALQQRRDAFVDALSDIPAVSCHRPQGAYNAFPDFSALGLTSDEMADHLLQAGVASVSGSAFGQSGEGHLRLAFTLPESRLLEAARRIRTVCEPLTAAI
jgi:aspartate/methionine/tyrosine aminotransferase